MTSITKLGLQGFAFGVALSSGGCMPQNQDEIAQLRAELAALKAEVATLKGETSPAASSTEAAAMAAPAQAGATPAPSGAGTTPASSASSSTIDWEQALTKHDKEERDAAWSRLREPDLFAAAKAHIKVYGASLNGVRCKTNTCLVTVNVPKKPKAEYVPLANPWAGTDAFAHAKPIYSGRTLWSYLLTRHEKDTKEAGAERVNPYELAKKSPELVRPAILVSGSSAGDSTVQPSPTKVAPAKPKAEPEKPGAVAETPKTAASKVEAPSASSVAKAPEASKQTANKTVETNATTQSKDNSSDLKAPQQPNVAAAKASSAGAGTMEPSKAANQASQATAASKPPAKPAETQQATAAAKASPAKPSEAAKAAAVTSKPATPAKPSEVKAATQTAPATAKPPAGATGAAPAPATK